MELRYGRAQFHQIVRVPEGIATRLSRIQVDWLSKGLF